MPEAPDQPSAAETTPSAGASRAALRLSIAGEGATDAEPRELALWLRQDPDLEKLGARIDLVERADPQAMALAEDVLVGLATMVVETAVFELFRAIYNHLRNRGDGVREVTVRVTDGVEITLRSEGRYSRRELQQLADRAARAIDPEHGAQ